MSKASAEPTPRKRFVTKKKVLWFLFIAHFFVVNEILIWMVRWHLPLANTLSFVDASPTLSCIRRALRTRFGGTCGLPWLPCLFFHESNVPRN